MQQLWHKIIFWHLQPFSLTCLVFLHLLLKGISLLLFSFLFFPLPFFPISLSPEGCFSEQCGCVLAGTFRAFLCCCVWKLLMAFSHTLCPSKGNLEVQRGRELQRARISLWSLWTRNFSSSCKGAACVQVNLCTKLPF